MSLTPQDNTKQHVRSSQLEVPSVEVLAHEAASVFRGVGSSQTQADVVNTLSQSPGNAYACTRLLCRFAHKIATQYSPTHCHSLFTRRSPVCGNAACVVSLCARCETLSRPASTQVLTSFRMFSSTRWYQRFFRRFNVLSSISGSSNHRASGIENSSNETICTFVTSRGRRSSN